MAITFPLLSRLSLFVFLASIFTTSFAANDSTVASSSYTIQGDGSNPFTIALNVPSPAQDNDLYFHISGPAQQWIAFGFGDQMAGALIFVFYTSANGNNVTVSPRLATGHSMPIYTSDVKLDLLTGTGINNGNYVVNAKCTGCRSWSGGSVDVTSTSQQMIWAAAEGDSLDTDDTSATIQQHIDNGGFTLNLARATGPGGIPSAIGAVGGGTGGSISHEDPSIARGVHAFFMVGSFLIGFPAGYLFLRVFEKLWMHWALQSIAAVCVVIGMAAGVGLSIRQSISPSMNSGHQIVGFVVVALVISTWSAGFLGHRLYKKHGVPAIPMKVHKVLGPATITLGLANCAYGFHFAGENHGIIGFVILTLLMTLVVSTAVFFARRRRSKRMVMNTPAAQNFRQGQMEGQYSGPGPQQDDAVPLQPYGGERPQPYSLPSYHSDSGYEPPQGPPPQSNRV